MQIHVVAVALALVLGTGALAGCGEGEQAPPAERQPDNFMGGVKTGQPVSGQGGQAPTQPSQTSNQKIIQRPAAERLVEASVRKGLPTALAQRIADLEQAPHYDIAVDIDWDLFTLDGRLSLTVTNTFAGEALDELVLLLYPNTPALAQPGTQGLSVRDVEVAGKAVAAKTEGAILRVPLPSPLAPGDEVRVSMRFKGVVFRLPEARTQPQDMALEQLMGIVFGAEQSADGGYGIYAHSGGVLSLGLWYPVLVGYHRGKGWDIGREDARHGDVSFFAPAHYDVRVTAPNEVVVRSSGVELGREVDGERATTTLGGAGLREFALMLSPDFDSATRKVGDVLVRSTWIRGHGETGRRVLDYAEKALATFERELGPYPWTELDVVEAPLVGGAGGVEFPGLVTIARMFYEPRGDEGALGTVASLEISAGRYLAETLEFVVAHEVAHEWWAAVVGSDSKRHPFVDEALANHSAVRYFETVRGAEAAERQRELQLRLGYHVARLAGAPDGPVDRPTSAFGSPLEYSAIVYGKGGLFFDAMRDQLGEGPFYGFLREYYLRHAFGEVDRHALVGGLIDAAPRQLRADTERLAKRWLDGRHGDEDIRKPGLGEVVSQMLGTDGLTSLGLDANTLRLLEGMGLDELEGLLGMIFDEQGQIRGDLKMRDLLGLMGRMIDQRDDDLSKVLEQLGAQIDGGADAGKAAAGLLLDVARDMVGDDPEMKAVLDGAGALVDLLGSDDAPSAEDKAARPRNKGPGSDDRDPDRPQPRAPPSQRRP